MKILHTADIHLGVKFSSLGDKGILQREQLRTTFRNVVALAISEKVDVVLIAGDLFDSNQQPQRNIDLVIEQFNLLRQNNIPVCLIPGTHDCLNTSSVYRKVDFEQKCSNLKIFADENMSCKEYADIGLTVYGKPNLSNRSYVSPLKGLQPSTSTRFHIAMAHGSFNIPEKVAGDDHVFKIEEIESSGMDYLALGHWHRVYNCSKKPSAWYSGPPEWIPDQKERGAILLITLSDSGEIKVEPRIIGIRDCDEIEINLTEIKDITELKKQIRRAASPDLLRKVVLKGFRDNEFILNTEDIEAELGEEFFHLSVIDQSHPRSREVVEINYEEQLIMTRFITNMKARIEMCEGEEKDIAEEALQYGIALLDGREVL